MSRGKSARKRKEMAGNRGVDGDNTDVDDMSDFSEVFLDTVQLNGEVRANAICEEASEMRRSE